MEALQRTIDTDFFGYSSRPQLDVHKLVAEHHRLCCRAEELEHELDLLKSSRSWRCTQPLRVGRLVVNYLRSYLSPGAVPLGFAESTGAALRFGRWYRSSDVPALIMSSAKGRLPVGNCTLRLAEPREDTPRRFALYVDFGQGFSEQCRYHLDFSRGDRIELRLPRLIRAMRVDPLDASAQFSLVGFEAREHFAATTLAKDVFRLFRATPITQWPRLAGTAIALLRQGGWLALSSQAFGRELSPIERERLYQRWVRRYDTPTERELEQMRSQARAFRYRPLISILMPVYNTPERWLRAALDSVLAQTYDHWELCIADDCSTRPSVRATLEEYRARDPRIRVVYRQTNGHISQASNSALEAARGEFSALMDHDDTLAPHALFEIVSVLQDRPKSDLLYSDEDRISQSGQRTDPYFKSDWNAELLLGQNFVSHLGVYRTALMREIGGFRTGFEGSQDWDLALRFSARTCDERIVHIPKVLYHWRLAPGAVSFAVDTKRSSAAAAERCVQDYLMKQGMEAEVRRIPSGGNRVRYRNKRKDTSLSILSFSDTYRLPQQEIRSLSGTHILFLHSDTRLADTESMHELLNRSALPGAGVVGARVIDQHGALINAGYLLDSQGRLRPVHEGLANGCSGYFSRAALAQEVWAVGLDGLCIERELALTCLQHALPTDIDQGIALSLAVREAGRSVIWTPFATVKSSESNCQNHLTSTFMQPAVLSAQKFQNPNLCCSGNYQLDFSR